MNNLKDKPYFCVLPWMHLHVNTNNVVLPCCFADHGEVYNEFPCSNDGDINQVLNADVFKKIRQNMLADKKTKYCEQCYKLEEYGNHSGRKHSNNKYLTAELEQSIIAKTSDDGSYDIDILYFDVRFSNVCNYKCRMCGAKYSTKWYEDIDYYIKGPISSINDIEDYCNRNIDYLQNVKYVYFAGGEPLVQDQHYKFLEWCVEKGLSPELYYQSNGSLIHYGKWNILDLWKNFEKVTYSVSVDCFGAVGEYIRTGFDTEKVKQNLSTVCNYFGSNQEITINSTFMAYNALYITEMFDEIANEDWVLIENVYPQLLIYPEHLQAKVLPDSIKQQALDKIHNSVWYEKFPEKFQALINNLKERRDNKSWQEFVDRTKELDKKRNTNVLNVLPELTPYYE